MELKGYAPCILILLTILPGFVNCTPTWTELSNASSPSFSHHSMAYDSGNERLVLVGNQYTATYQAWFYNSSGNWSNAANITSTSSDPEVAYDKSRRVIVLYTGAETWEFDGTSWTNMTNSVNLPVNCADGALLQYDSVCNKTVLVASNNPFTGGPTETWLWDGVTWVNFTRFSTQPVNASLGGVAFDEERREMVFITSDAMQTWTFNCSHWTQKNPATFPSPGVNCIAMAYDATRKVSVFFGGESVLGLGTYPNATWEWNGSDWSNSTVTTPYSDGNIDYSISYFGPQNGIIMHGGWTNTSWEMRNSLWLYKESETAENCSCSNCTDCEERLNSNCSTINLTANISNHDGTCIDNPANFSDKTVDCQGNKIDGDDSGADYGIYLISKSGNTIRNCTITDFSYGFFLSSSLNNLINDNNISSNTGYGITLSTSSNNNTVTNNIANSNSVGIYLYSSAENNTVTNNIANSNSQYGLLLHSSSNHNHIANNTVNSNNYDGIYLWVSSNNNTLTNNTANNNGQNGIYMESDCISNTLNKNTFCSNNQSGLDYYDIRNSGSNSGDNNTCDTSYNWSDTNTRGCTYTCTTLLDNICYCSNCSDCMERMNDPLCSEITLDSNIANYTGACITTTRNNKTLNCDGYSITGNGSGSSYGILIQNNFTTIRDCVISSFNESIRIYNGYNNRIIGNRIYNCSSKGIYVLSSDLNNLTTNTIYSVSGEGIYLYGANFNVLSYNGIYNNTDGIYLTTNSKNNTITDNTVRNNTDEGLHFTSTSGNNSVSGNTICYNTNYDIYDDPIDNFGSGNFCNLTYRWNDTVTGLTNCAYYCGQTFGQTFNISLSQGWNLISIPLDLTILA